MSQSSHTIEKEEIRALRLNYLRYLPPEHGKDPAQKWPMILFLHGAGERGEDLELVKIHGLAKVVETRDLPFVIIAPQCPRLHWWSDFLPLLDDLIQDAIDTLNVDPDRVYLTGMSMGGYGTWHMAVEYPHRFAAIAPICGGGPWMYNVRDRICAIQHIPTWVFHGEKDDMVPVWESKRMVEALKACDGDVRLTLYPEATHDSWTETYNNPALYEWFLSNRRQDR